MNEEPDLQILGPPAKKVGGFLNVKLPYPAPQGFAGIDTDLDEWDLNRNH